MSTKVNYVMCFAHHHKTEEEKLKELESYLTKYTLDPRHAPFACNLSWSRGVMRFHGNFYDISCAFSIDTNDQEVIDRLISLIDENTDTITYKEAKAERRWQNIEYAKKEKES